MSDNVGLNFLNSLLGGLTQSAQADGNVVVEANFKIRMADPKKVEPVMDRLEASKQNEEEASSIYEDDATERGVQEKDLEPPIRGLSAGVRIPEASMTQTPVPGGAAPPVAGARIDATTRQLHDHTIVPPESPALVPNTISVVSDYNPIYQDQFDNYLRTREFEYMYGPALRGQGAPRPSTPRF